MTVDGVVVVGYEVARVGLMELGVGFFFLGLFLFGAGCGGMDFWWNG